MSIEIYKLIFYLGFGLSGISVLGIIASAFLFKLKKVKLDSKLDNEYGHEKE